MRSPAPRIGRRRAILAGLGALLAAGCMATIPVEDGADRDVEWRQRARLSVGERAVFDAGALEIVLIEVGGAYALVQVDTDGAPREARLTPDPGGYETFPPYEIRLESTRTGLEAVLEVTKR